MLSKPLSLALEFTPATVTNVPIRLKALLYTLTVPAFITKKKRPVPSPALTICIGNGRPVTNVSIESVGACAASLLNEKAIKNNVESNIILISYINWCLIKVIQPVLYLIYEIQRKWKLELQYNGWAVSTVAFQNIARDKYTDVLQLKNIAHRLILTANLNNVTFTPVLKSSCAA